MACRIARYLFAIITVSKIVVERRMKMIIDNKEYNDLSSAAKELNINKNKLHGILLTYEDFNSKVIAQKIEQNRRVPKEGTIKATDPVVIAGVTYDSISQAAVRHGMQVPALISGLQVLGFKTELVYNVIRHSEWNKHSYRVSWHTGPIKLYKYTFTDLSDATDQLGLTRLQLLDNIREFGDQDRQVVLMHNNKSKHKIKLGDLLFRSKMQTLSLFDIADSTFYKNIKRYGQTKDVVVKTASGNFRLVDYRIVREKMPFYIRNEFDNFLADKVITPKGKLSADFLYEFYKQTGILQ